MKTQSKNRKARRPNAATRELMVGLKQLHHAVTTGDYSKVTVRTMEIAEPDKYGAKEIQALRASLDVSQSIFASMVGVSSVLVAHWEHGLRKPSTLARRLFDTIKENPTAYRDSLLRRRIA